MTAGSVFGGISGVKPKGDYNYIGAGDYIVYVNEFGVKKTRKGPMSIFFNLTILAVLDTSECVKWNVSPHRVGEAATWMVTLDKDSALPQIKRALMNLTTVDENQVTEEFCESLCAANQPLRGYIASYSGKNVKTKEKGIVITDRKFVKPFTKSQCLANAELMAGVKKLGLSIDNSHPE